MARIDAHCVQAAAEVERSIVAGGTLRGRVFEVTVEAHESGETVSRGLSEQPTGPRV